MQKEIKVHQGLEDISTNIQNTNLNFFYISDYYQVLHEAFFK